MPLLISMADDNIFAGNKVLYIIINPLSLTPTAPGRGSADTLINKTACIKVTVIKEYPLKSNPLYIQKGIL